VSARDRAKRKAQTPLEQLDEALALKKTLPRPIARGLVARQKVSQALQVSRGHLDELPALLAKTTPGSVENEFLHTLEAELNLVVSRAQTLLSSKSLNTQAVDELTGLFIRAIKELGLAKDTLNSDTRPNT
jgi:hypothetical protein